MRINHNINSLNAYSRLTQANFAQGKSLEKLSSGQRINRAGDDAAGLAISEKMRSQIRGLDQAGRNSQDGISMIQTAEGALSETHSILQRMRELAVQSANDTNTTSDRSEIGNEMAQLSSEINRIAGSTEFNKQTLLDGSQSATALSGASTTTKQSAANSVEAVYTITFTDVFGLCAAKDGLCWGTERFVCGNTGDVLCTSSIAANVQSIANAMNGNSAIGQLWRAEANGATLTVTAIDGVSAVCGASGNLTEANQLTVVCAVATNALTCVYTSSCTVTGVNAKAQSVQIQLTDAALVEGAKFQIGGKTVGLWDSSAGTYVNCASAMTALGLSGTDQLFDISLAGSDTASELLICIANCTFTGVGLNINASNDQILCINASAAGVNNAVTIAVSGAVGTSATASNGTSLQIGANAGQTFSVSFGNMSGTGISVTSESSGASLVTSDGKTAKFTSTANVDKDGSTTQYSLDVSTADYATAAISAIDDAITAVSSERSKLGAYQNRLEHTINNLSTSSENLTAAESRIRDVDMAKEMMEFTKNNILNQAATAMLAQANQQPQGVLQLLR